MYPRAFSYDVEGGAIFSKNSTFVFFDGAAWTPRLRSRSPIMAPDLWQIIASELQSSSRAIYGAGIVRFCFVFIGAELVKVRICTL